MSTPHLTRSINKAPAAKTGLSAATDERERGTEAALAQTFVERGVVTADAARRALTLSSELQVPVVSGLLRLNAVAETPLYQAYAEHLGIPVLRDERLSPAALATASSQGAADLGLSREWLALKACLVFQQGDRWCVACREAPRPEVASIILRKAQTLGVPFDWALVPPSVYDAVMRAQRAAGPATVVGNDDLRALRELAEEGPTIELVNAFLSQAVTQRASDVHIEPEEGEFVVRVRVDGDMLEQMRQPRDRFDAVACRIKILSNLDIAERRMPQDGRINARVNGEAFDIRVSVLPGALGESIVLRLLRQERKPARLQDLGMSQVQAAQFESWSRFANGIVLVTGPTGSGKSTTLYTALELANDRSKKIITVEDPVEYKIRGITQLQVNADIGFTFAAALRSILRHDPDVILVGEIRDEETARIAIQSSLTGHLVLSTLHTNSAIGAVTRLADMGIEPFLIAASVRGLMAQRLVRRLCTECKQEEQAPDEATRSLLERWLRLDPSSAARPYKAVGCPRCSGTGYFGRFAIYDLIEITPELAHLITQGASESDLLAHAGLHQGAGLLMSGVAHVAEGSTTLAEVLRATGGL